MPIPPDTRACLTCGTMLRGRIDKKFCDDYCRSAYNNNLNRVDKGLNFIRRVNIVLRNNRRILEELLPNGNENATITKDRLTKKGFNFNVITSAYSNNQGAVCYFCYEYGYVSIENEWLHIIKRDTVIK